MSIYKGEKLISGSVSASASASASAYPKPDWAVAVAITEAQFKEGFTAPSDGMIVGILYTHGTTSTGVSLSVNGVEVARNKAKDSDHILNVQCPVGKDDVIVISDEESQVNSAIRFVPWK